MGIRRPAALNGDGQHGFVIHPGLKKVDPINGNESLVYAFEHANGEPEPGLTSEQPIANVRFLDGSPANIEVVD